VISRRHQKILKEYAIEKGLYRRLYMYQFTVDFDDI
jgi:hypothetical protein